MTERPNVILVALVAVGASLAAILTGAVVALGGCSVPGLTAAAVGALSACIIFLHEMRRVPIGTLVLAWLSLLSLLAWIRACGSCLRERWLLRAIPLEPVTRGRLAAIVRAAGGRELYLLPARRPMAFCFGLVRPCVVVSSGLLERLEPDEQEAAVWHEAYHARSREPLKCLLARFVATTFFWMPVLRDLLERYLLAKELAADRVAVDRTSRGALAGALCAVTGEPVPDAVVGLGDLAAARIDRLLDPEAKLPPLFRRKRLALSAIGTAALGLLFSVPAQVDLTESRHLHPLFSVRPSEIRLAVAAVLIVVVALVTSDRSRPAFRGSRLICLCHLGTTVIRLAARRRRYWTSASASSSRPFRWIMRAKASCLRPTADEPAKRPIERREHSD